MKNSIIVTLLTILFNTAYSQNIENIEKYIEAANAISNEYITQKKLIGVSIGVLVDEQIVWHNALGIRDVENNLKPDSNTVFRLASLSKPMTAIAVLQLYEKGIIDIDQKWGFTNEYLDLFSHSKLEIIKDVGHDLIDGDKKRYYEFISDFLKE